ncbi:MAG: hypothetical protein QXU98_09655 [Candidatus Parvarchaeota archaeon]
MKWEMAQSLTQSPAAKKKGDKIEKQYIKLYKLLKQVKGEVENLILTKSSKNRDAKTQEYVDYNVNYVNNWIRVYMKDLREYLKTNKADRVPEIIIHLVYPARIHAGLILYAMLSGKDINKVMPKLTELKINGYKAATYIYNKNKVDINLINKILKENAEIKFNNATEILSKIEKETKIMIEFRLVKDEKAKSFLYVLLDLAKILMKKIQNERENINTINIINASDIILYLKHYSQLLIDIELFTHLANAINDIEKDLRILELYRSDKIEESMIGLIYAIDIPHLREYEEED